MSDVHSLKCHPGPFAASWRGDKPYEVRVADRELEVDDTVQLREYDPGRDKYTGRSMMGTDHVHHARRHMGIAGGCLRPRNPIRLLARWRDGSAVSAAVHVIEQ